MTIPVIYQLCYTSDLSMVIYDYTSDYIHIHLDNHWSHGIVPCVERCHWQFHLSRGFAPLLGSVVPRPSRCSALPGKHG